MSRRRFLGLVGGLVGSLGGCLGRGSIPGQSTDAPTPSPPVESRVEIPPCPVKPDPLTRENVVRFAIRFERAYVVRVVLREHERVTYVQFKQLAGTYDGEPNAEVTHTDDGWLVRFPVTPAYGYRPDEGTAESAHVDPAQYTANYLVTTRTVYRAKVDGDTPGDPRKTGAVVHCPPD